VIVDNEKLGPEPPHPSVRWRTHTDVEFERPLSSQRPSGAPGCLRIPRLQASLFWLLTPGSDVGFLTHPNRLSCSLPVDKLLRINGLPLASKLR
jgi:hypothetical protein